MWAKQKQTGFTIVELLIVIVVIGILAAITIVAYTSISQRAIVATLQSDLDGASKQLSLYQVENSAYPDAIDCSSTPTANTICLKSSSNTAYTTFTPNNTTNPQTFCLTATNGTTAYYTNNTAIPTAGGCSVTNLLTNTSVETDTNNLQNIGNVTDRTIARTLVTDAKSGSYVLRITVGPSGGLGGYGSNSGTVPIGRYTGSLWIRSNLALAFYPYFEGSAVKVKVAQQAATLTPNVWSHLWLTFDVTTAGTVKVGFLDGGNGAVAAGTYVDVDAFMLTQGNTLYNFVDGSSPGWIWNGVANASTSTGPSL